MKFESNFNTDQNNQNSNTGGDEFNFDWGGEGDAAASSAQNAPKNENQDFGGGWVDF